MNPSVVLKKQDYAIDVMRWIAIIGVVIHHLVFESRYNQETLGVVYLLTQLLGWCVLWFFGVSGYLMGNEGVFSDWIKKRAKRLIIPYFSVSFLAFLGIYLFSKAGLYPGGGNHIGWAQFACRIVTGVGYGPQFYFLPYLFFTSMLVFICRRFCSMRLLMIVFLAITLFVCVYAGGVEAVGVGLVKLPLYILAYCVGGWLAALDRGSACNVLLLCSPAAVGVVLLGGGNWLCYICFPWLLYYLIREWPHVAGVGAFFAKFSTGAVYLWHAPVFTSLVSIVLLKMGILELWNFSLTCIGAIVLSLLCDRVFGLLKIRPFVSL